MKNYMIVGATSGIGEACAKLLSNSDVRLVVVGRNQEKLEWLKNNLEGEIIPVTYDLADLQGIKEIYSVCRTHSFKLDGMVYSAGMDGTWPVKVNPIAKMRDMMDVNCFAFVELAKQFYSKRNSNDGASVVAISSIASLTMEPGMMAYSTSKAALNAAVKTMAKEFVRRKIRVNAVLPAGVYTPMAEKKGELLAGIRHEEEDVNPNAVALRSTATVGNEQSLGMITAEIVAEEVRFLLSDKARYKTGALEVIGAGRWY